MKPLVIKFTEDPTTPDMMQAKESLAQIGLDSMTFKGASTSIMNEKADSFETRDSYIEMVDEMKIGYAYKGTGLKALMDTMQENQGGSPNPDDLDAMLENMSLSSLSLDLSDYGLLDKIIAVAAEQQGTTPNMMKMQAKAALNMPAMMAQNQAQADLASNFAAAMTAMIDNGGTVSLNMAPSTAVKGTDLKNIDPASFDPATLGISVTHSGN